MKYYTIITGASGGIGRALAYEAAKDHTPLVLIARRKEELESLANDLDTETFTIIQDLAAPGAIKSIVTKLKSKKIEVNGLINNAGFGDSAAFANSDITRQLDMVDLNIKSILELTHALLSQLTKNHGRIMNVASVAGFVPGPYMATYYASKSFVLSWSEALSEELRGKVSVTVLCPGTTKTEFFRQAGVKDGEGLASNLMPVEVVAKAGWDGMKQGKVIVVPGLRYRFALFLPRLLPRSLVRRAVARFQDPNG